jgi:hypothetical protein
LPWDRALCRTDGLSPPSAGSRSPAAAEEAAELAYMRGVETKLLLVGTDHPNSPSRSATTPPTETLIE